MHATSGDPPPGDQDESTQAEQRGRSTIAFPYDDIDAALDITRVVHDTYGGVADPDNIAAELKQVAKSGAFRVKVSAARLFGFVNVARGAITATDLGVRALSDQRARAEGFLNAELYSALYDKYKETPLPSEAGLTAAIAALGVTAKQVQTARQVFLRSAQQAGFFRHGTGRLVLPPSTAAPEPRQAPTSDRHDVSDGSADEWIATKPAIIAELFRRLPADGEPFDERDRALWLNAFLANLDLVYGPIPGAPHPRAAVTGES